MKLSNGVELVHAHAPYDPRKAHDYYMRTRKLHPRQGGQTFTVHNPSTGAVTKLSAAELQKQTAYAAERVSNIKARLVRLTTELHQKVAALKRDAANAKKPPTAAEKAKAAADAKKYRQSHKQVLKNKASKAAASKKSGGGSNITSSDSKSSHTQSIAELKGTISKVRDTLKAAVATQRALTSATKNG